VAERIFNFQSQIGRNSKSPEYHFRWQLSQLFDGPLNGSNRLAICELQQSETRPVTKTVFLADHTFTYITGFWQNFAMTSVETSYMKNVANELSFLLVTHTTRFNIRFGRYGVLKSCFSSGQVMDRLDCKCFIRFLEHKMGETCWRLSTRSRGNKISFLTPTQTHIFDNWSNVYDRFKHSTRVEFGGC
jgi:hypothetical protein